MSDASQLNTSEPRAFLHKEILFWSKYGRIVFKLFGQFQQFFFVVHPLVIDDSLCQFVQYCSKQRSRFDAGPDQVQSADG